MNDLMAKLAEVVALFPHTTPNDWQNDGPHLFTDTRVQVCCGRGYNECCGSPDVDGSVEEIGSVIDDNDAPLIAAAYNFLRTHHAELEAMARDARGDREESWEVWQDDMPVAGSDSLPEAKHYLAVYQQDGPVTLKRVVMYRETITPEQIAAMHNSAREG